jgi:hypothetical protein
VVVRKDLLELEIDKVLRVKRTCLLLWLGGRLGGEIQVSSGRNGADAEEDEGKI